MVESCALRHGVTVETLLSRGKAAEVVSARHDLASCLWGSGLPYTTVGRLIGRDHTTVMSSVRKELGYVPRV
jgi:chromosomal replication initiation ATPase DnaA